MEFFFFEFVNFFNVYWVELCVVFFFIGGELFVVEGFEVNGGFVNMDDNYMVVFWFVLVVLFVGEGDVNLGNVVGGVGRWLGVGKYGWGVIVEDNDVLLVVVGFDGEMFVVVWFFDIMVLGEGFV